MKIRIWLLLCVCLVLTSCVQNKKDDEIVKQDEVQEQELSIVPSYQLSKENYKMILPFRPSKARGIITNQIANRLDIDEMENGLRRHSTKVFSPKDYYFEEGQYITSDIVHDWIDGLNPEIAEGASEQAYRDNPRALSHVIEQNFLERNEDNTVELVGASIGIALKSVYRFQTEPGGPYHYENISEKDLLEQGKEITETLIKEIREIDGLSDVPLMIALYREEEQASPVPGNFVAQAKVDAGSASVGNWESIDEEYVLFPSGQAKKKYFKEYEMLNIFGKDIADYFPNYVGYVGKGFYVDEDLKILSIEIPIEFYASGEIVGFTQYIYGIAQEKFSNKYSLEIKVTSGDKVESLLYREAGTEEITVHMFH